MTAQQIHEAARQHKHRQIAARLGDVISWTTRRVIVLGLMILAYLWVIG